MAKGLRTDKELNPFVFMSKTKTKMRVLVMEQNETCGNE